ncbi:uncharacterized protein K444DRAFT_665926 [Hyaloscypha bicolor E]|uniref:BTB domain-containing protein n=1 Tax=Hyaloscypha bicolor E TaxID=1095630 RepID=A0A2J6SZR9_9HELO|nr:uncharacterized protein K444DRAFT_665926 [Hyaloscypha bicolor E]PMD56281.1 hypothetical protein K444DRAFT_665926 [Hyaloscypha bicolor E]
MDSVSESLNQGWMRIWAGFGLGRLAYELNLQRQSDETLAGLRSAGEIFRNIDGSEELGLLLSGAECKVFHNVIHWLNKESLRGVDEEDYDYNAHISEWCTLFVLATRLKVFDLADEALERYQTCRMPHWQGSWFPLPSEVEYLWYNSGLSTPMRDFVTNHIVAQLLTQRCQANLGDIAVLLSCDVGLILDVLRSVRSHLTDEIGATQFCGVEYCSYHLQVWTQFDVDEVEKAPSESEFSDQTEPLPRRGDHGISSDDEEAFAAAEVLEALSETGQTRG